MDCLLTLQKSEIYASWNDLVKHFKMCHIFGIWKPTIWQNLKHFVRVIYEKLLLHHGLCCNIFQHEAPKKYLFGQKSQKNLSSLLLLQSKYKKSSLIVYKISYVIWFKVHWTISLLVGATKKVTWVYISIGSNPVRGFEVQDFWRVRVGSNFVFSRFGPGFVWPVSGWTGSKFDLSFRRSSKFITYT